MGTELRDLGDSAIDDNFSVAGYWSTGHAMTVDSVEPRRGSYGLDLSGIDCRGASFCLSVGSAQLQPVTPANNSPIEPASAVWNGTQWTTLETPTSGANQALAKVACSTPTDCLAIGGQFGYGHLVEQFNGRRWTVVPVPKLHGRANYELDGVGVVNRSSFLIVGSTVGAWANSNGSTIIEEYNGTSLKVLQD